MNGTETDKFTEENLGLVRLCANRFRGKGIEYDDLYSTGCIGLIKAVNGFDRQGSEVLDLCRPRYTRRDKTAFP